MLSRGLKYSVRNLITEVNYCARVYTAEIFCHLA